MTRFGVVLPLRGAGRGALLDAARLAEQAGLDSVWVYDSPGDPGRRTLECWTALAAVAATTRTVGVGALVVRVTLRPAVVLAAMAATASRIAPGRLTVGLGIGDASGRAAQASFGIPFPPRRRRLGLLEDAVGAIRRACPEVPLWLGGTSDEILRRAAGLDGWNHWGQPGRFASHLGRLRELAAGRMPETSWAGSFPGVATVREVVRAGAGHVLVAVGASGYERRIAELAETAGQVRSSEGPATGAGS